MTTATAPQRDLGPVNQLLFAFMLTALLLLIGILAWPGGRITLFHQFNALGGIEATVPFWAGINALADTWLTLGLLLPFVLWRPRLAILMLFAAIVAAVITHGIKPTLNVLRPPALLDAGSFNLIGHSISSKSFPSGHTVTAFTFAGLLILGLRLRWPWAIALLLLASIMGLSRIVAGVHWPTDVLAGAIIGLASAAAAVWIVDRWPAAQRARWPAAAAIFVCAACALSAPWVDLGYPQGMWAHWLVAAIGLVALFAGSLRYWPGFVGRRFGPRSR